MFQTFLVDTGTVQYRVLVGRNALSTIKSLVPAKAHRVFVLSTQDVWNLHGEKLANALQNIDFHLLTFAGGEHRKRMAEVETLAEQMANAGADRSSVLVAFGGGIVTDLGGFLASIFMRGIPVIQVPTTLLAQVDAAVGGKTGTNLVAGKNLVGTFHQPLAVIVDPTVLATLPEREFRAGLQEILKAGVIRDRALFETMATEWKAILAQEPAVLDGILATSIKIKCEVVSADEKEGDLRRILNFGHTIGHALEAETSYAQFLHGEAVAFGMKAATHLSQALGTLTAGDMAKIVEAIDLYGPFPSARHIAPEALLARLGGDKKTIGGKVHFVLAHGIGDTKIVSGVPDDKILAAIRAAQA